MKRDLTFFDRWNSERFFRNQADNMKGEEGSSDCCVVAEVAERPTETEREREKAVAGISVDECDDRIFALLLIRAPNRARPVVHAPPQIRSISAQFGSIQG